jgi:hypothetical protein
MTRTSASATIAPGMESIASHCSALVVCATGREAATGSDFVRPRVSSWRSGADGCCSAVVVRRCCWTLCSGRRAAGRVGAAGRVSCCAAVAGAGETGVVAGAGEAGCDVESAAGRSGAAGAGRAGAGAACGRAGAGAGEGSGFGTGAGSGCGGPPAASAGAVQDKPIAAQQAATGHIALERNVR